MDEIVDRIAEELNMDASDTRITAYSNFALSDVR